MLRNHRFASWLAAWQLHPHEDALYGDGEINKLAADFGSLALHLMAVWVC